MKSGKKPFVSVVTPVYNGDRYLTECIESVLAQSYENWEYVIANNCSTDRTREIAESFAKRDSRIRLHNNQEFVSAFQNQNHALRQMSPESKYCKVVHADDWLFPECITRMVELAEAHPTVGIVGSYGLRDRRVAWGGLPYPSTVVPGREICRRTLLEGLYVFGYPTSLLIRCDLVRNQEAFYDESNTHADKQACFEVLRHSDFGFIHQVLTFNRTHNDSRTSRIADQLNTYILGNLMILKKYGPVYLTNEEYEQYLKNHIKHYYTFLARSLFQPRKKEFWEYHKNGLKNLGYPLSHRRLLGVSLLEVIDHLLNPKKAVEKTLKRMARSRGMEQG